MNLLIDLTEKYQKQARCQQLQSLQTMKLAERLSIPVALVDRNDILEASLSPKEIQKAKA